MAEKNCSVKIRRMKISDIPQITRIIKEVLSSIDARKARKDLENQSKRLYVAGDNFVAEADEKVVGMIGYWRLNHHPKKVAQLDWFAVDKEYQNRGIGSKLLSHLVKELVRRKFQMLCCEESSKDTSSKSFYNKHGFVEFGKIRNYWEDDEDLILIIKRL